jgi:hypothetical protein
MSLMSMMQRGCDSDRWVCHGEHLPVVHHNGDEWCDIVEEAAAGDDLRLLGED